MTRRLVTWAIVLAVGLAGIVACGGSIRQGTGDGTLTARVITALVNDPIVGRYRFEVETFQGVVMLSGEVDSQAAQARAIEVVRAVDDVRDVRSTIRVVP